ncbi:MAG TPA: hypothetical protein VG167_00875 [Verrucomicrobiae bacterium]|nr:hypothetical protein [Verrucomicrobiae bacterium]
MKAFFELPERIEALERAAQAWKGTPFRHNSKVRQVGANCVMAIVGVLEDAGFKVPPFDLVPTNWCRYQTESAMEKWLDAHEPWFAGIERVVIAPGDVVGFKVGLCVHHLGVVLPGGRFFQCSEGIGAAILSRSERVFKQRLTRAWRPMDYVIQH